MLHAIATALVFALARTCGASSAAASVAATLFGVFPRLTESVCWISGRTDILASALALSALYLHLRQPSRWPHRIAAAGLVALGLLAKEVAIGAAVGIAVVEIARARPLRANARALAVALTPLAVGVAAYAALRVAALRGVPHQEYVAYARGVDRIATVLQTIGQYVLMLADPLRPRLQVGVLGVVEPVPLAVGVAAVLAIVAVVARRRALPRPEILGALFTSAAALGLVLHVAKIMVNVVAADRFLYLPVAAGAVAAAAAFSAVRNPLKMGLAVAAAAAVPAFGVATYKASDLWSDEVRLWRHAAATTPDRNALPEHELANALYRLGKHEEALPLYAFAAERSTGLKRAAALANVATTLSDLGRLDEAAERMREAMAAAPPAPVDHYNFGVLEARRLRFDAAEAQLRRALDMMPGYGQAAHALQRISEWRVEWASLSSPKDDEPTPLLVRRAGFHAKLGTPHVAALLWSRVVRRPDASGDDVLAAAQFFAAQQMDAAAEACLPLLDRHGRTDAAGELRFLLEHRRSARTRPRP